VFNINENENPSNQEIEKRKINLDADAFYRRVQHKDILEKLLTEIQPVDFHDVIGLPHDKNLRQKHKIYATIKHLLITAKNKNWNLCKCFDYIYVFNGSFWKQCSKDDFRKFLSETSIKMGLPDYEARIYDFSDRLLKQFLSDAHLKEPVIEKGNVLINLNNGTFKFTENVWGLHQFNPDEFLTHQLAFDYDVNAKCPLFENYLLKVLPDIESQMVLQEFAGNIFANLNLEKMLVLLGGGGNGKSVYFNVINALLGKENVLNFPLGMFGHEYNRARLSNVLVNYSSEKGFDLHPDILKTLISGEPLQAREPHGKSYSIYNKVKFIINCNELPRETESTDAYFRRFLIVLFETKISKEEKDIDLADKIIASELPGVFNWLLEGLKRIIEQKQFTHCPKADIALIDFRKQTDSVQLFIEETRFEPSQTIKEALKPLYNLYKEFCKEDNYKPLGKNRFSKRLESKGFDPTRMNDGSTAYFITKKPIEL
jgi:putative DNA primase/helicase